MHLLLNIILAILCGLVGVLGFGLIGYLLLGLFTLPHSRRWKLAGLLFALPAGLAGLVIGFRIGQDLVPPV